VVVTDKAMLSIPEDDEEAVIEGLYLSMPRSRRSDVMDEVKDSEDENERGEEPEAMERGTGHTADAAGK
jgi:hypothetical protein